MKNFLYSFWILQFFVVIEPVKAQNIQWQRCYGGTSDDDAKCIIQTFDGNILFTGRVSSNDRDALGNQGQSLWSVKLDQIGNILWSKYYGATLGSEHGYSVIETQDHGFLYFGDASRNGQIVSGIHGFSDYWILKTDSIGNFEWQKCIGGFDVEYPSTIKSTMDGGYIVIGSTDSFDGDIDSAYGNQDAFVAKLNSSGSLEWTKILGGLGHDIGNDILSTNDGGYFAVCGVDGFAYPYPGNHGGADGVLYKLDSVGNILWERSYGGSGADVAERIISTSDGNFVIGAITSSQDGDITGVPVAEDLWLFKIDNAGTILWDYCYGEYQNDGLGDLKETSDHGFIACGTTGSICFGFRNYFVLKIDSVGNELWRNCFGGSLDEFANSVIQTSDSTYLVAGVTKSMDGNISYNHGNEDAWIISIGNSSTGIDELTPNSISEFSCQLTDNGLEIKFVSKQIMPIYLTVSDLLGRDLTQENKNAILGENKINIEVPISSGVYLIQLATSYGNFTKKLFK